MTITSYAIVGFVISLILGVTISIMSDLNRPEDYLVLGAIMACIVIGWPFAALICLCTSCAHIIRILIQKYISKKNRE